jgi:group I intron endonuclease
MSQCIYAIVNCVTGRKYIGSTTDVIHRWRNHRSQLNRGVHQNRHLQGSWRKHGWASFDFIVVEAVEKLTDLASREQHHLDLAQPNVYNTGTCAENPVRGTHISDERKIALSAMYKGKLIGKRPHKPETRRKLEEKAARRRGVPLTDAHKTALREAWAKIGGHWTGKRFSDEHRAKLREAWVRRKARVA